MFGQRFQQIEVAAAQHVLDVAHDVGVVEGILDLLLWPVRPPGRAISRSSCRVCGTCFSHSYTPMSVSILSSRRKMMSIVVSN